MKSHAVHLNVDFFPGNNLFSCSQNIIKYDGLKNLCKKDFISAFDNVPLGDNVYGLLGCTPSEMLHVSGTGLLKYV
jgi:hypothetical protein